MNGLLWRISSLIRASVRLVMAVVVAGAVNHEQVALELMGEVDRRALA